MTKPTKTDVVNAFDDKIKEWRERQIDVLGEVPFPTVNNETHQFKSMGWINFATDFTDTVFGDSAVNQLRKGVMDRMTIPLWVLGKAQSALESHLQSIRDNNQKIVNAQFMDIRDKFTNKISAIADTFVADPAYGRKMINHVFNYVKDRDFKDNQQMRAFLRRLIDHANIVETDPAKLRKKINPRFKALMKKIKYLWLASHHTPEGVFSKRYNLEFRPHRGARYQHIMKGEMRNKETRKIIDQIIATAWGHDVVFVPSKGNVLVTPTPGKGIYGKPKIYRVKSFRGDLLSLHDAEHEMYMGENQGPLSPWRFRKDEPIPIPA